MDKNNKGIAIQSIINFLQDEGYKAKLVHGKERSWIESAMIGVKFRLYLYTPSCIDGETVYDNFMFDAGYLFGLNINVDKLTDLCNSFNAEYRFLKTYVTLEESGGFVCLQLDGTFGEYSIDRLTFIFNFYQQGIELFHERIIKSAIFRGDKVTDKHNEAIGYLIGSNKNPDKGLVLYREAANEGFAGSQNNLGDLYEVGKWLPSSKLYAAYWYARSAERGEPTAYLSLANLLSENACDENMLIEAMKYAILAFDELPEGERKSSARATYKNIEAKLTEEQISDAMQLSEKWMPLYFERRRMNESASLEGHQVKEIQLLN